MRSPLTSRKNAPRQPDEGAPEAWIHIAARYRPALLGVRAGMEVFVLTWLHLGRRQVLRVHPRGKPPLTGVFATRSPDRPNPIGLHRVRVLEVRRDSLRVQAIEAVDGTPVVDIKKVLGPAER